VPIVPFASGEVVVIDKAGLIVITRLAVALRAVGVVVSVTLITAVLVPAVEGVPVISPAVLIVRPAGNPEVAVNVYDPDPPVALT
jgi:hypothetical protein